MKAAVEAILFAMGGSVEVEKIAAALEMKVESTEELLADMMEQYKKEDRGGAGTCLSALHQKRDV